MILLRDVIGFESSRLGRSLKIGGIRCTLSGKVAGFSDDIAVPVPWPRRDAEMQAVCSLRLTC
jgi:hypothetical protein